MKQICEVSPLTRTSNMTWAKRVDGSDDEERFREERQQLPLGRIALARPALMAA